MGRVPEVEGDYIDHRRMEEISQAPSLLDYWTDAGMKPVNIGKVHAFHDRWDLRGDAPRLFTVHGNPTGFFNDSLSYHPSILDAERVFTDTHGWQIGGIIDVRPEDTETWRLGDMAVKLIDELAAGGNPFFLRVSFHAPHVACYVPPEYFTDPSLIDLPVPGEDELADKPRFERGPLKTYAGASLTLEQIDLARGTYYGMVALVDVQVGRIIKALEDTGQLENTIIAFTSDQGFQLGEHGLWKKRVFYDGNVRVPLIFRYPGKLPQGVTIDEPVEMTDFLPTLMEISGFTVPADIRGASLLPLISGEVKEWREACFSEIDHSQSMYDELRQGTGRRVMVRTGDWKLVFFMDSRVEDSDGALYNLAADPYERHNLYHDPAYGEVTGYLEKLAQEWTNGKNFAPVLKD